jgi:hypothetical protein
MPIRNPIQLVVAATLGASIGIAIGALVVFAAVSFTDSRKEQRLLSEVAKWKRLATESAPKLESETKSLAFNAVEPDLVKVISSEFNITRDDEVTFGRYFIAGGRVCLECTSNDDGRLLSVTCIGTESDVTQLSRVVAYAHASVTGSTLDASAAKWFAESTEFVQMYLWNEVERAFPKCTINISTLGQLIIIHLEPRNAPDEEPIKRAVKVTLAGSSHRSRC